MFCIHQSPFISLTLTSLLLRSGTWSEDKASGVGKLEYSNGDVYEGQWDRDQRHGEQQLFFVFSRNPFTNNLCCVSGIHVVQIPVNSIQSWIFEKRIYNPLNHFIIWKKVIRIHHSNYIT